MIRNRIRGPLNHFLALGKVRTIEIEESLFACLWDNLGGGATETYTDIRQQLIEELILSRVPTKDAEAFRIHPSVHIQLEKHLERNIGPKHVSHVDYYLSGWYREQFERRRDDPDMGLLSRYVYHAIRSGNMSGALEFLLAPDRVRFFHHMGLATGLRPILSSMDIELANRMRQIQPEMVDSDGERRGSGQNSDVAHDRLLAQRTELIRLHCPLKIELAHCENDLSDHVVCLERLDEAEKLLDDDPNNVGSRALRQRINYLRGISYSDLGQSEKCIRAYNAVVLGRGKREEINEQEILALGYLAFELRFVDQARSESLGRRALELATEQGERSLIAKCACSLGQTVFFAGRTEESTRYFEQAEDACRHAASGVPDRRELGRVLVHYSMVMIAGLKYTEALKMLDEASEINAYSGDRRRIATAQALRGICLWRQGTAMAENEDNGAAMTKEGTNLLKGAIEQHWVINDWRNLIPEALSVAYMLGSVNARDARRLATKHSDEPWAKVLLNPDPNSSCELFEKYWASYFRTHLLES